MGPNPQYWADLLIYTVDTGFNLETSVKTAYVLMNGFGIVPENIESYNWRSCCSLGKIERIPSTPGK